MTHKHKRYALRHGQLEDITGQKPTVTELDTLFDLHALLPYRHVENEDMHDELAWYIYQLAYNFTVMSNLNEARLGMVIQQHVREYLGDTFYRYAKIDKSKDGV